MDKKMQPYLEETLGKTIQGIIVKECESGSPANQVFLVFEDGTFFEFYSISGEIMAAKGIKPGAYGFVREYMGPECRKIIEAEL